MDVVFLIGRVLFALIFIFSGTTVHLLDRKQAIEYARARTDRRYRSSECPSRVWRRSPAG
jgi:hypothetical protein